MSPSNPAHEATAPIPAPAAPKGPPNPFANLREGMMVEVWETNHSLDIVSPGIICKVFRDSVTKEPTGEINVATISEYGVWGTSLGISYSERPAFQCWRWRRE